MLTPRVVLLLLPLPEMLVLLVLLVLLSQPLPQQCDYEILPHSIAWQLLERSPLRTVVAMRAARSRTP